LRIETYAKVCSAYKDTMAWMQQRWLTAESTID